MYRTSGRLQIAGAVQSTLVFFDLGTRYWRAADTVDFMAGQSRCSELRSFADARNNHTQSYRLAADALLFRAQTARRVAGQPRVAGTTGAGRIAGWHLGYFSNLALERWQTFSYRCLHGGAHAADGHPAAAMVATTLQTFRHSVGHLARDQTFRRIETAVEQWVGSASQCWRPVRRADRQR